MIAIGSLWLPILVSAVAVFVLSSLIHMVMPWHKGDFARLRDEDGVSRALRPFAIAPGEYMLPRPGNRADMQTPEFQAKVTQGPVLTMTVWPNGMMPMGKTMATWFIYLVVVSALSAFLASGTVAAGAHSHRIFHVVAFASFLSYSVAAWPMSIWYHKPWTTTIKTTIDGLIFAVVTGLIFVWLWPAAAATV